MLAVVVCVPPVANSKFRSRATGIPERSGFGIIVSGTTLRSGFAGVRTMRNSRNFPTTGSGLLPASAWESERSASGLLPFACWARLTIETLDPTA